MKKTAKTVLLGLVAAACALSADTVRADRPYGGHGGGPGGGHDRGPGPGHHEMRGGCVPRPCFGISLFSLFAPPPATVVVQTGYWREREERVWIEGYWVESTDSWGRRVKTWQPGYWETRRIREWVQ